MYNRGRIIKHLVKVNFPLMLSLDEVGSIYCISFLYSVTFLIRDGNVC